MKIKGLIDEDYVNYKLCSMFIVFPYCTWKCEKECGKKICQNSSLAKQPIIEISTEALVRRFRENPLSEAIVCGGLEPFDSFSELVEMIDKLRENDNSTVVIYTGYNKDEIAEKIDALKKFENVIVKFGRFIPDAKHRFDDVLGVELASDNQFAERIS